MCLIIAQYPNSPRQTRRIFEAANDVNKDGIGIAYAIDNILTVKKGFDSLDDFIEYYDNISVEASILVHFRAKSAGVVSEENLHPFVVNDDLCFAFNGTISELNFKDSEKSDTFILNQIIIQPLCRYNKSIYKDPAFRRLLSYYVNLSKMVFLNNEGEFLFINELRGEWDNKENPQVWYSNKIWETKLLNKEKYEAGRVMKLRNVNEPRQYYLPAPSHNNHNFEDAKKKFYRVGDKYYQPLSADDLHIISRNNGGIGTGKMKKRHLIARLEAISEETRLKAFWEMKGLKDKDVSEPLDDNLIPKERITILDNSIAKAFPVSDK